MILPSASRGRNRQETRTRNVFVLMMLIGIVSLLAQIQVLRYTNPTNVDEREYSTIDSESMDNSSIPQALTEEKEVAAAAAAAATPPSMDNANKKNSTDTNSTTVVESKVVSTVSASASASASASHVNTTLKENNNTTNTTDFQRYDGVVIVTKVLTSSVGAVGSWLCYLSHAYNDKMKYDVVVFTSDPWTDEEISEIQKIGAPAKVTVAVEGPPLAEQIANMTKEEVSFLRKRCGVKSDNETLTWYHYCTEKGLERRPTNLGYAWQAEFRSYHIWNHPAIQQYKYMMWLDTDAFATEEWKVDPMKAMVENDLAVMYSGFPYGKLSNDINLRDKLMHSYGSSICWVRPRQEAGRKGDVLEMEPCTDTSTLRMIAGSHHITNLEVFRKDVHQQFLKNFTGDYRFSRKYDDQVSFVLKQSINQSIFVYTTRTDFGCVSNF